MQLYPTTSLSDVISNYSVTVRYYTHPVSSCQTHGHYHKGKEKQSYTVSPVHEKFLRDFIRQLLKPHSYYFLIIEF